METHTRWSLLLIFAFLAPCLVVSCSRENGTKQHDQNDASKTENEQVGEMGEPVINGLSMQLSLADDEKRLVRVAWKNMQDTDLTLTLTTGITLDQGHSLKWPYFDARHDQVPRSTTPIAKLTGFVDYGDNSTMLVNVLQMNGMPLYQNEFPVEKIDWKQLESNEEISALYDLGSLFDGIADDSVKSVKIWFSYTCLGSEQEGDMYWRGVIKSNVLELTR